MEGFHELEICGARIVIDGGRAEVTSPPKVSRCPMRARVYGTENEDADSVLTTLKANVEEWGMFTSERRLRTEERTVSFGTSEIFSDALRDGLLDCAVTVCEGAGTFIGTDPQIVQAVGAHMTGILRTTPIPAIQEGLREGGCELLDEEGTIDQMAGLLKAASLGHKRIGVTLMGAEALKAQPLKSAGLELGVETVLAGVHTSAVCGFTAEMLVYFCDILHLCASAQLWKKVGAKAMIQMGTGIPVMGMSAIGKRLILNRAMAIDDPLLVMKSALPRDDLGEQPRPLYQPDCATDLLSKE